jgi:Acetyltransferase (GNAT) family
MLPKLDFGVEPVRRPRKEDSPRGGGPTSIDLIKKVYVKSPHSALYTPLCKVKRTLAGCQYRISIDGTRTSALVAFTDNSLEFTWSMPGRSETLRNLIMGVQHRLRGVTFAPLMETGSRSWSQMMRLPVLGRYFRAFLPDPQPPQVALPTAFEFIPYNPSEDTEAMARFINRAYPSLPNLTSQQRLSEMTGLNGYYPDGWFCLKYIPTGEIAGFAISGLCRELKEGFVDWIQVGHSFRNRGLGKLMVGEAVRRLLPHSDFITSSGSLDAPFAHGDLYKQCGFTKTRQWTLLGTDPIQRRQSLPVPLIQH